jgi:hypothetical protein
MGQEWKPRGMSRGTTKRGRKTKALDQGAVFILPASLSVTTSRMEGDYVDVEA